MPETVEIRLQLLLGSDQISPEVTTVTRRLSRSVENYLEVPLTGTVAMSFITHLALGLERLRQGTPVESALSDDLLEEVQERIEDWHFAQKLAGQVEQELGMALPENEIGYMAAHISALSEVVKSEGGDE